MSLPTITSATANTTIASAVMNTNLTNLRDRTDIAPPTADHVTLTPGTSKLVKMTVLRQDDTTNTYAANSVMLFGWGQIAGSAAAAISETVTFGNAFSAAPVVLVSALSYSSSTVDSIDDFTAEEVYIAQASDITTTNFKAYLFKDSSLNFTAGRNYGYSWVAIGVAA